MAIAQVEVKDRYLALLLEDHLTLSKNQLYHTDTWKVIRKFTKGLKNDLGEMPEELSVSLEKPYVVVEKPDQHKLFQQVNQELRGLLTTPTNSTSLSSEYNERWCLLFAELGGSDVVDYIKEQISRRKDCAVDEHMFQWLERNKKKIQDEGLDPPENGYRFMNGYTK